MRKRQITIKEIADKLGISKSTVSRALRDTSDISAETKSRVVKLAEELDYQPNRTALSLLKGKSFNVGVIIPSLTIPFYAKAISSMQKEVNNHGYNLLICQSNENFEQEKRNLDTLIKSGVDGIAISLSRETENCEHIIRIQQKGIPVVLFNRIAKCSGIHTVKVNDYLGSRKACEYLINKGRKKIAYIQGPKNLLLSKERYEGYLNALLDKGLVPYPDGIQFPESDFTIDSGEKITTEILRQTKSNPPDAIYCICDAVAIGAISAIYKHGLRIPEDIAVVGFTNEPMSAFSNPSLTTVSQPIETIGTQTAKIIIGEIKKRIWNESEIVDLQFDAEIVVRESA